MNKIRICALAVIATLQVLQPAFGYQTTVTTRSYANRLPSDDLIVIESRNNSGIDTQWFATAEIGNSFQINMIDYSVGVRRKPPILPGVVREAYQLESLDKLHELKVGENWRTYDMRAFFNEDFMWIEVWPSGSSTAPVKSSYQLSGSDRETYEYYRRYDIPGTRYANQKELTDEIQKNYANKYDPDFINLIQYPPAGRNAVLSSMLTNTD